MGNTTGAGVVAVTALKLLSVVPTTGVVNATGRAVGVSNGCCGVAAAVISLKRTRFVPGMAFGSRCSADVISMTFESSAIMVSRAVDANGARVVTKCDGMGLLVVEW